MSRANPILARITPTAVCAGMALTAAGHAAIRIAGESGWREPFPQFKQVVTAPASIVAYVIALSLCLQIAAEYEPKSWLRYSWLSLASSAGTSIFRHLVDSALPDLLWPGYGRSALSVSLKEGLVAVSLLLLLAGILMMWWTFHRAGLGFKLGVGQLLTVAVVFASLTGILWLREGMWDRYWTSPVAFGLQLSTQLLLAAVAVASALIYQICRQMGGGRLAAAMQWIAFYAVLRLVLYLTWLLGRYVVSIPELDFWRNLLFCCAPWIFALAASNRSQLTVEAIRLQRASGFGSGHLASHSIPELRR